MLAWWQAIVLGLVEGITEYLPVSSTGHLILVSALLGLDQGVAKDAVDDFLIVVQGGAILAVVGLYWARVRQIVNGLIGRDADGLRLAINLGIAFVPAAIGGVLLNKTIKAHLFHAGPVLFALAAGGVFMLWLARQGADRGGSRTQDVAQLSMGTALGIGLFQVLAMWPGTSRSMVTIGGGILLGLDAVTAAEFSFLLGLPTLGAACGYDLLKNFKHAAETGGPNLFQQLGLMPVGIGVLVAALSAAVAVRWLVGQLTHRGLGPFGWYRIGVAIVLGGLMAAGIVQIG